MKLAWPTGVNVNVNYRSSRHHNTTQSSSPSYALSSLHRPLVGGARHRSWWLPVAPAFGEANAAVRLQQG